MSKKVPLTPEETKAYILSLYKDKPNTIHGDVDLLQVGQLPLNSKKVDDKYNIHDMGTWIELGEHTGNAHVVAPTLSSYLEMYLNDEDLYIKTEEAPAIISHPEHSKIFIPLGINRKVIETEYDPFAKVIKQVVD
jgi:hypothetical protein